MCHPRAKLTMRQGSNSGHPHMIVETSLWKKAFKEHSFIYVLKKEAPHTLNQVNITVPLGLRDNRTMGE